MIPKSEVPGLDPGINADFRIGSSLNKGQSAISFDAIKADSTLALRLVYLTGDKCSLEQGIKYTDLRWMKP